MCIEGTPTPRDFNEGSERGGQYTQHLRVHAEKINKGFGMETGESYVRNATTWEVGLGQAFAVDFEGGKRGVQKPNKQRITRQSQGGDKASERTSLHEGVRQKNNNRRLGKGKGWGEGC